MLCRKPGVCTPADSAGALEPSGHHHPGLLTFLLRSWCFPCRHGNLVTRICSFASVRLQRGMVGGVHLLHTHILYQAPAGALYLTQKLCGSPHPTPAPVGSPNLTQRLRVSAPCRLTLPHGLCILHWALQAPPAAWTPHPTLGPAGSPYVTQKPCRSPYPTLGPEGSPCCTHGLHTPYRALWVCPASYRNPTGVHTPHQALPHTRTLHPSQALWAHPAAHRNSAPQTGPCGLALPHTRTPCSSLHLHGEDLVSMKQYLTKTTCRGLPSCWAGGNIRS